MTVIILDQNALTYDMCSLFTTSNATSFCTHNLPESPDKPATSTGPIDPNAACVPEAQPGLTTDFYDGCHIRTDQDNFTTPATVKPSSTDTTMEQITTTPNVEGKFGFQN